MKHPFNKKKFNTYGFEIGQELEWFEWLCNYEQSLRIACNTYREHRYDGDHFMEQYLNMKVEMRC